MNWQTSGKNEEKKGKGLGMKRGENYQYCKYYNGKRIFDLDGIEKES